MRDIATRIEQVDWQYACDQMTEKGYVVLKDFLTPDECQSLVAGFSNDDEYRKTVVMERYRFGLGSYKYWKFPLPDLVQELRENMYAKLAPIANLWMTLLGREDVYPTTFKGLQDACRKEGQKKPTPLILKYGEGGFNCLHQDLYGDVYFPIQAACFLSQPDEHYTGGEFVMTQQVPRAQSKAIVLRPRLGDMILFTTNFRPVEGSRGYYKAVVKHGVSEVQSGSRYTMGVIFHDAVS